MGDALITRRGGSDDFSTSKTINLPITISTTQPTAIRSGHLWINSSLGSSITSVVIQDNYDSNIPDGTLLLVSNSLLRHETITDTVEIQGGNVATLNHSAALTNTKTWLITSLTTDVHSLVVYLANYPLVYSKINGVLDVETAYVWNGSTWLGLSQKGEYLFLANYIRNINADNTYTINSTLTSEYVVATSLDGTWILTASSSNTSTLNRYKRTGNVFEKVDAWNNCYTYNLSGTNGVTIVMRRIAATIDNLGVMIALYMGTESIFNTNYYQIQVQSYNLDGTVAISPLSNLWSCAYSENYSFSTPILKVNEDGSRIAFSLYAQDTYYDRPMNQDMISYLKTNGTFILNQEYKISSGYSGASRNNCFITGNTVYYVYEFQPDESYTSKYIRIQKVVCGTTLNSRTVNTLYSETASTSTFNYLYANLCGITSNKKYLVASAYNVTGVQIINLETGQKTTTTLPNLNTTMSHFVFSLDDKIMYCSSSTSMVYDIITQAYNVIDDGTTLTFTWRNNAGGNYQYYNKISYGVAFICPRAHN